MKYNFPCNFARRGAEAREKVVDAFVEYNENGGYETASRLAQDRAKVLEKTGLDRREVARMMMPRSVGQFDNSVVVTFAVLSFSLRDPELLARIRSELEENVTKTDDCCRRSVDTLRIRECPLLLPTIHEVLRYIAVGLKIWRIEQDYTLILSISSGRAISFGELALPFTPPRVSTRIPIKFIPDRFLGVRCPETQMPDNFPAFGGGGNICLGRHFARTIVPGAVGTLLMAFEFELFNGKPLCVPNRKDLMLGHATPNPFGNTIAAVKARDA